MSDPSETDRWREIDDLFRQALGLDPDERTRFLDERCGDDENLRRAVARLLEADSKSRHFLGGSAETLAPEAFAAALDEGGVGPVDRIGERVDAWRLVRRLGRGGMAGVYLAERADGEFRQTVAIKFLRRGLDSDDFVRRFVAERQILSSLHHPNIAQLIGGGTTEERLPYLVMEHVDGIPITEYCDAHRSSVNERLRLFDQVARAVQYAHASLVVHRDIKPGNILVTDDARVKLLDFGIAKLLDPDADPGMAGLTRTGFRPLTLEYASPEQVRGGPITTASDIYQLGVLLYRLLTGGRPYAPSGGALEEAITGTLPIPPSVAARTADTGVAARKASTPEKLGRRLRGDLDVIVLKALRKEPDRRYGSAFEMAEDVRRHLEGRPIVARRESRLYRARKFVRRNAWLPPVAAVVTILMGAYVLSMVRHGRRLEEERNVARDVQHAFVGFFTSPDPMEDFGLGEGRRDLTVREAILEGADRVRADLADRPAARAELFTAMSEVLADLDEVGTALRLAEESLALEDSLYGEDSAEVHETLLLIGDLTSDPDSARAVLRRRLRLSRTLYGDKAPETATSLQHLGLVESRSGNLEEAVRLYEAAARLYRRSDRADPRQLAWTLGRLSETLRALGRFDRAVAASREAYEIMRDELGERHSDTAVHGVKLAGALTEAGDTVSARRLYESSLATMDAELGETHGITLASRENFALLLVRIGDLEAAETIERGLVSSLSEKYGPASLEVAGATQNLAVDVKDQGRYGEAESLATAAYRMFLSAAGEDYYRTAFPLLTLGEIRLIQRDYTGAEAASRDALRILRMALPAGHYVTAVAECRLGRSLAGRGDLGEARSLLESAVQTLGAVDRPGVSERRRECLEALDSL